MWIRDFSGCSDNGRLPVDQHQLCGSVGDDGGGKFALQEPQKFL